MRNIWDVHACGISFMIIIYVTIILVCKAEKWLGKMIKDYL